MADWSNFFFAQTGASAALAGLIFVAVSINLNRILSLPRLPNRALEALSVLMVILVVSSLMLVPGRSTTQAGITVLVVGLIAWVCLIMLDLHILKTTATQYRRAFLLNIILSQLASLPYVAAGIVLLSRGLEGLYWLVPGVIFSYLKALLDAWVLLVEINR